MARGSIGKTHNDSHSSLRRIAAAAVEASCLGMTYKIGSTRMTALKVFGDMAAA